jgi:adenosylcobinamide kinase/adenosylcobinamide-phosphate guanylyltransferase
VDEVLRLGEGLPHAAGEQSGYRVREVPGGWDVTTPDGGRLLCAAGAAVVPVPPEGVTPYDVVLLDLVGKPEQLGGLRARGLVTRETTVGVLCADHRVSSEGELERRCAFWGAEVLQDGESVTTIRSAEGRSARAEPAGPRGPAGQRPWRVLVLGGARSGKSAEAELRLAAEADVTYVAAGGPGSAGDEEWAARIAAHRARRPAWWRTVETTRLAEVLAEARGGVLIDGMGTWLAAVMAECGVWAGDAGAAELLAARVDELVGTWRQARGQVVAVSDETGLGVVPQTLAGRMFRDELGRLNQRLAAESEEAVLVVAGRALPLAG